MIEAVGRKDRARDQPLPSGTVTLLLADIEGSTGLWDDDGAAMAAATAHADAIIDEAVDAHGGTRPIEQGEGDSFVAAFSRASDALACAAAIQHRTADSLTRFRMGIHTGEVEVHDERTYLGSAVNRAARIRDAGHGGQILLSQTTADLAADLHAGQRPAGMVIIDRGVHALRGLNRPEHVWELAAETGATRARPPLRSVGVPTNLGVELTTFVGRSEDLEVIGGLLDEARAVTLTGAGGSGKTRLAMQVAARRLERHPGGAWIADLVPAEDDDALLGAVCDAVGIAPSVDAVGRIGRHLDGTPTLLILDNCEHLIEPAARLADALLRACPSLSILATSREPLGVAGEVTFRVPSLAPEDAAALFVERGRRADPTFSLDGADGEAVADICARLEGMPLAIELAAARLRTLTTKQIRAGLNDRFRLLIGGVRTAVPRHQTLQASVDWSYALLLDVEREVLNRLSVFAGSWSLRAAEAVCSGDRMEPHHVLDVLTQLVDKSLVAQDRAADRFVLTETVRQYAATQLADSGQADDVRRRHYGYYLSIAQVGVGVEDERQYRRSIAEDDDNIRRALQWAADQDDPSLLGRMCARLFLYWSTSTRTADGRRWFTEVVARESDPARRAGALGRLSLLHWMCGDPAAASAAGAEAVETARAIGDRRRLLGTLLSIGQAMDGGRDHMEEAAALATELEDHEGLAWASWQLSMYWLSRDPTAADPHLRVALDVSRAHGIAWVERLATVAVTFRRIAAGEVASVRPDLEAVVEALVRDGEMAFLPTAVGTLMILHVMCGDRTSAERFLRRTDEIIPDDTNPGALTRRAGARAVLCSSNGDWAGAIDAFESALGAGMPKSDEMTVSTMVAVVEAISGRPEAALAHAHHALVLREDLDGHLDPICGFPPQFPIALAHRASDDVAAAEDAVREALAVVHDRPTPAWVRMGPMAVLASIHAHVGREEEAARLLGAIDADAARVGLVPDAAMAAFEDGARDACRAALGDERFDELVAEGAAMSWDEALAYAARGRGTRGGRPLQGGASLTPTERQVVDLVLTGATNKAVAARLFMSVPTVKTHLTHAYAKLGVSSRAQLIALAATTPSATSGDPSGRRP